MAEKHIFLFFRVPLMFNSFPRCLLIFPVLPYNQTEASNSILNNKSILLFSADRKVCQPEQLMDCRISIIVKLYKCVCVWRRIFPTVCTEAVGLTHTHTHIHPPTHYKIHIYTTFCFHCIQIRTFFSVRHFLLLSAAQKKSVLIIINAQIIQCIDTLYIMGWHIYGNLTHALQKAQWYIKSFCYVFHNRVENHLCSKFGIKK